MPQFPSGPLAYLIVAGTTNADIILRLIIPLGGSAIPRRKRVIQIGSMLFHQAAAQLYGED
jgi:hypothetical protein